MASIPYIDTPSTALQKIRPRHREIMRRLVCGQTQREISRDLCLNEGRLSIIVNSPLFQTELRKMEKEVRERVVDSIGDVSARIAELQTPALDVLEHIVINPDQADISLNLRQKTAVSLLELGGIKKKDKNDDGMSDFAQFITEAYREAKTRALGTIDQTIEAEMLEGKSPELLDELENVSSFDHTADEDDLLIQAGSADTGEETGSFTAPMHPQGGEAPSFTDSGAQKRSHRVLRAQFGSGKPSEGSSSSRKNDRSLNELLTSVLRTEGLSTPEELAAVIGD